MRPDETHKRWVEAFNAGDLEALMALYELGASVVAQPGQVVTGTEAIREVLGGLLPMRPMILETKAVVEAGDIALLASRWSLSSTGPDGNPINVSAQTSDVVRRQPDGRWLFVIDNPFGDQISAE